MNLAERSLNILLAWYKVALRYVIMERIWGVHVNYQVNKRMEFSILNFKIIPSDNAPSYKLPNK